jgi:hypothetical protein
MHSVNQLGTACSQPNPEQHFAALLWRCWLLIETGSFAITSVQTPWLRLPFGSSAITEVQTIPVWSLLRDGPDAARTEIGMGRSRSRLPARRSTP